MIDVEAVVVKDQVREAAGQVWYLLNQCGPQTLTQLRKKLSGGSDLSGFALGWLAREDRVEILKEKRFIVLRLS